LSPRIRLNAGPFVAEWAPQVGGAMTRFDHLSGGERTPLMRRAPDRFERALDAAMFPLVPFSNRIRGGRFTCGGREIALQPNMAGDPSPLHGQGWVSPWEVERVEDDAAELVFNHRAGEWPWDYEARQSVRLTRAGLEVRLTCRNLSSEPMPCGLGLHPYFPCDASTLIDTAVEAAWTIDAQVLPVERVPAEGRYSLARRTVCGQGLDNGFEGWSGEARIVWPAHRLALRIASPDAHRFQLYSPAAGGMFVAEPVQNANCALNAPQADWPALGIRLLAHGETAAMLAVFEPFRTAPGGDRRA